MPKILATIYHHHIGFPDSSVAKESACNAGDPSLTPGSGRSTGEGIGYPLQYAWTSLVAQLVKNLPAMWETWVQPLHWEDPLEKGKATHSSILVWRIPWTAESMRLQRAGHDWVTSLPISIQGWLPLGLTGLSSLLSKGFSRVFSSTTVWKHQ